VRQGRLADARQLLQGVERLAVAAAAQARLHLAEGEPGLAAHVIERCLTRRGRGLASAPLLGLLVEAALAEGRPQLAADVAGELEGLARATGQLAVEGLAALARARVAAATADGRAVEHLEQALAAFEEAGLPYELAQTRLLLAGQLADTHPDVARGEARVAMAAFDQLRATPDADRAAALLRELGEPGRPRPRASGPLTTRESEVLALLADGRSNAQIAARLHISLRTAEDHVSKILAKLGLGNRTEAAAYALRSPTDRLHA
jgi:DNA-binding CsgD family transcriptional regulator